uniref:Tetratricopeptide repeat protein 39B n=1 Tax=Periophthalmus magnuspinnatus TaxID=409849 RepID=A0A3B3ZJ70_9GOBI
MKQLNLNQHIFKVLSCVSVQDCFEDAFDRIPAWKDSMYHALGYSSILVMQATMTFEQRDIQAAMSTIKEALNTCHRFRKRNSMVGSLLSKQSNLQEEEMHAELCYAECLLQKATLTFVQDENMISFIKGGIKIRTSYQIYKDCQNVLNSTQDVNGQSDAFRQFEGGVKLGVGSFNLMLSLLPQRILRLLEFIGFSGNRGFGLSQLREGASNQSLRSILCALTLLFYNTYVSLILGTGEGNLEEAEALLEPYRHKYPKGSIILFYSARISTLRGQFEKAVSRFEECVHSQSEWRQIHHLCYWELMWTHSFQQHWVEAYHYAQLLCAESRWSKAIYVYQKAAILSMMSEEEVKKTGENIVELFRSKSGLKERTRTKPEPELNPVCIQNSNLTRSKNIILLCLQEMMYVWNGFTIVGKRPDCAEALLVTIEKAEEKLREDPNPSEYHPDDSCLVQMLKGLCLKHLGRPLQAELCFTQVLSSERRIRYDHYLVPFTLYELGLLYKQQGDFARAASYIENAKTNYKDYSMESRLHFRIHAALNSLKGSPVSTP